MGTTTTVVLITLAITLATIILGICVTSIIMMSRKIKDTTKNIDNLEHNLRDIYKDMSELEGNMVNKIDNVVKK